MQNHHLNKLVFKTRTTVESKAFAIRSQLKANWQQLVPDLNESFDGVCAEDEFIHIPKLTISLVLYSQHPLITDNPTLPDEHIKEIIKSQIIQQVSDHKLVHRQIDVFDENQLKLHRAPDIKRDYFHDRNNQLYVEQSRDRLMSWFDIQSYLSTGQLPWYVMSEVPVRQGIDANRTDFIYESLQILLQQNMQECVDSIIIHHSPQMINRLVQLFDNELRLKFFDVLLDKTLSSSAELSCVNVNENMQKALLSFAIASIERANNKNNISNTLIHNIVIGLAVTNPAYNYVTHNDQIDNLIIETAKQFNCDETIFSRLALAILPLPNRTETADNNSAYSNQTIDSEFINDYPEENLYNNSTPILFAGIILLYPYLAKFFKDLGYMSTNQTIKKSKYNSAVAVAIYMLTGKQKAVDYQLHFIKWFLGIPERSLISVNETLLSKKEIALADTVLLSLKSHWPALKNTSINNLRESFLQRSGVMKLDQEQCYVHIERRGIDVLIDQIPFSLSIIRLPWIKQPIIVNW